MTEKILQQRYNYIVGIDFGTFSTSFSYAHVDDENNILTVTEWPRTNQTDFGGRVASSCIYKNVHELPRWGGNADKSLYKKEDLFHVPSIKLYLTDFENQTELPDGLTPVKLVADYLKQVHQHGVEKMKTYFGSNKVETELLEIAESNKSQIDDSRKEGDKKSKFKIVKEDMIRYIVSYPDNQGEKYKSLMEEALRQAGIINPGDPKERLIFITESEATAYICSRNEPIAYSQKPYIVCDVGGTFFGLSTIKALEFSGVEKIELYTDVSIEKCGNIELDQNMRDYLDSKISASEDDEDTLLLLKRFKDRVFKFYIDHIKQHYEGENEHSNYNMDDIENTTDKIKSDCIEDNRFMFSDQDMKEKVFDPVINKILNNIQSVMDKFDKEISGIFISGTIGQDTYLKSLIEEKFGTADIKITAIKESKFAVSKGLIAFGFRERGQMIPYFEDSFTKQKQTGVTIGNKSPGEKTFGGAETIDFKDCDYIIGLDFGTTYSGFAFADAKHFNNPNINHISEINEVKNWPKQKVYSKAASMLYYDEKMKYKNQFGEEARLASQKPKANGYLLRHFKLLLSRKFNATVDDKTLKSLNGFEIVKAINHYLHDFNEKGVSEMRSHENKKFKNLKLGYIVTIPAMWSDEAKNTMKAAVIEAGLVKKEDIDTKVHFITEAEAAALYCEQHFQGEFNMSKDQRFMICDAGGGTVDLVTFEVSQDETDGEKLVIKELTSGDGDDCGSIYLDKHFENYIIKKLEEYEIEIQPKAIEIIVNAFIKEIKPNFPHTNDPGYEYDIEIDLPAALKIPVDYEGAPGFIVDNKILISYADMENEVFTPVVDKVLNLIEKQLKKLPEGDRTLDAILLVGGFGRSEYLHKKISDKFEDMLIGARFVGKPPDGDLAICRGAVSFGLRPRLVAEGITRYSYGLKVKDEYREGSDDPSQRITGYKMKPYCQNVFSTIIHKNTSLSKGRVHGKRVFVTYPNDPVFVIYSTDEEHPDRSTEGLNDIMTITAKMPELLQCKEGDKVDFELWFEMSGTDINIEIYHNNKRLKHGIKKIKNIVTTKFIPDTQQPQETKWRRVGISFFSRRK